MRATPLVLALLAASAAACNADLSPADGVDGGAAPAARSTTLTTRVRYHIERDGSLTTPYGTYRTIGEWYRSAEFRRGGPRCASAAGPTGSIGGLTSKGDGTTAIIAPADCTLSHTHINGDYHIDDLLVVPVVFHVVYRSDATGNVSDEQLLSQIEILNEDYGKLPGTPGDGGPQAEDTRIRFVLAGIDRHVDDTWFDQPEAHEGDIKSALHWDTHHYLNVYTIGVPEITGYLGQATFPQESAGDADDGIFVQYDTVGRDTGAPPYDQGRTLTHEVGHYLGLLHTFEDFQGSDDPCTNDWDHADLIEDTPGQDGADFGCPASVNHCGSNQTLASGNVPDYMDYSDDACMNRFTIQQANRAVCGALNYRGQLVDEVPGDAHVFSWVQPNAGYVTGPIPAGTDIIMRAVADTPGNKPEPPVDIDARIGRQDPDGSVHLVAHQQSSGKTPAEIVYHVPVTAFYVFASPNVGGGMPVPHVTSVVYVH